MRNVVLFFLLLLPCLHVCAQTDDEHWIECIERWAEEKDQDDLDDEILEYLASLKESPININDTNSSALQALPFINPIQVSMLKAYIRQYGSILSWTELGQVGGFDSTTIQLLKPIATLKQVETTTSFRIRDVINNGKNNIVFGGKGVLEPISGYLDSSYLGGPYRMYFRYQFKYHDKIIFQISGDKDAGEEFFKGTQKQGFDYYGYYLQLKDIGKIKKAIVGKYQLQFGQGLTLWSGFSPWNVDGSSVWRYGQGIRTSSAFCEYGYLQGLATTISCTKNIDLTTFYSFVQRDAMMNDSLMTIQTIYNNGYHRTELEIERKNCLNEQIFGGNIHYQKDNLSAGITAYRLLFNKPIMPADYVYNSFAFSGNSNTNIGAYYSYRYRNIIWLGEAALSTGNWKDMRVSDRMIPLGMLSGFQYYVDSRTKLSGYYRHYSPSYQNLYANPLGQNTKGQNENGLCINLCSRLPLNILTTISFDFFQYPWMKYRVYAPSYGNEYRVRLEKDIAKGSKLIVQYRAKSGERNELGAYQINETDRRQLNLFLNYTPNDNWKLSTRLSYSWFREGQMDWEKGYMAYQDVSFHPTDSQIPITLSCRYSIFNISDYDARIFSYENDLLYEYSTPSFYGQGYRFYTLFQYKISNYMTAALKYDITQYVDRESIGSGHEKINRSHKQKIKLQLRLNF